MRYRIANSGSGFVVTVEDGDEVLFSIPADTLTDARALVKKAASDGVEAVRPEKPKKKGK